MATDITINLKDDLEAELNLLAQEYNVAMGDTLSPSQYLRNDVRDRLRASAAQRADRERLRLRDLFSQATPEEQAEILSILDKYRA